MGIRRLNKFLCEKNLINSYPNINTYVSQYRNNNRRVVIAIDFWLYANKFSHSCDGNIMIGFWNQIVKLLSHRIVPLYIIDGAIPVEKEDIVKERRKKYENNVKKLSEIDKQINKFIDLSELSKKIDSTQIEVLEAKKIKIKKNIKKISKKDLRDVFELFDLLQITYIKANYEADALCAKLFDKNIIISCLSDDMDMLALGCKSTLKFHEGQIIEYNLNKILTGLDINYDQFIDMCILFGCDYLKHPIKLNYNNVYNLIYEYGSIEGILENANHENININNPKCRVLCEKYYDVKDIYLTSKDREDYEEINLLYTDIEIIDVDEVFDFLCEKNFFVNCKKSKSHITKSLGYINNHIKKKLI